MKRFIASQTEMTTNCGRSSGLPTSLESPMTSTSNLCRRVVRRINPTPYLFLAILFVTRATWAVPPDECKPVPFDEVREELGPRNGVGVARIVLRADDVTFNSLLCLRQSLKSAH